MKPRKTDIGIGLLTLGSFLRLIFPEEGAGKHCQHDLRIGRGGASAKVFQDSSTNSCSRSVTSQAGKVYLFKTLS